MSEPVKPSTPWGWLLALLLALLGGTQLAPCPEPAPAPVVVSPDRPKIDWLSVLAKIVATIPKTDEPAPQLEVLILEGDRSTVGLGQIRAKGTFTKIEWLSDTPYTLFDGGRTAVFSATAGDHTFIVAGSNATDLQMAKYVMKFGPPTPPVVQPPVQPPVVTPDPTVRPSRATYIHEQRSAPVPPPVLVALDKLNRVGVVASSIDQHVISGKGQAPVQYATALAEARKAGIPCLVVEFTSGPPRVVKGEKDAAGREKPMTEAQVLEAVR